MPLRQPPAIHRPPRGATTRTDLEQMCHRYATVAASAAFVSVLGIMLYALYIGYLIVRGTGSPGRTP